MNIQWSKQITSYPPWEVQWTCVETTMNSSAKNQERWFDNSWKIKEKEEKKEKEEEG